MGGKIDFDQNGRLSGNWFLEDADGYKENNAYCGNYLCPYWNTHLAFVYDFVDPNQVRISIGYDTGITERGPYGIKTNSLDPAQVSVSSGLVRYELVELIDIGDSYGYKTKGKAIYTQNSNKIVGTMLVQMLDDKKIRIEIFNPASDMNSFTNNSRIYVR